MGRKGALYGSVATIFLAIIFTFFQWIEYSVSSFTISDGAFGTCFFFGTGFHGYGSNILFFKGGDSVRNINNNKKFNIIHKRFYSSTNIPPLSPYWVTGFSDAEASFSFKASKKSTSKSGWNVIPAFKFYSTAAIASLDMPGMNPYWVTGFTDAEGSFIIDVAKQSKTNYGRKVTPEFRINLHLRDILLIRKIHSFFGVGSVYERENGVAIYSVKSLRDINNIIIPHFDKYPLITQKKADYLMFKEVINLLNKKAHSDIEGVKKIIGFKSSMNKGLSETLKSQFPLVLPEPRPINDFQGIPDFNWLSGFVDGEGCFFVNYKKSKSTALGIQVITSLYIYQNVRDEVLLTKLIDYLQCGRIDRASTRPDVIRFTVSKFRDILEKIVPFFLTYPLHGIKSKDFMDLCAIVKIMENKGHLTPEGLKEIKSLKSGMNNGRISDSSYF